MQKLSIFTSLLLTIFMRPYKTIPLFISAARVYLSADSGQTKVRVTNANTDSPNSCFLKAFMTILLKETIASFGFSKLIKSKFLY